MQWLTIERPTWCHLLLYFTYYVLNMFRTLIYPSSGACDSVAELPHRSSCSQFVVCGSFCYGRFLVVFICRLKPANRTPPNTSRNKCSRTQRTENKKTDVVIQQHSRKVLKMDILMSETCWAHNKWNNIASVIKLVFHSSKIAMMHGPINIRLFGNNWVEVNVAKISLQTKIATWTVLHFRNSSRGSNHSLSNSRKRNYSKNSNCSMLSTKSVRKMLNTACLIIAK